MTVPLAGNALIDCAKKVMQDSDAQGVVIMIVQKDGTIDYGTYANTIKKCKALGWWTSGTMDNCLSKVPFTNLFGWGNGGKPKALYKAEKAQISHLPKYLY